MSDVEGRGRCGDDVCRTLCRFGGPRMIADLLVRAADCSAEPRVGSEDLRPGWARPRSCDREHATTEHGACIAVHSTLWYCGLCACVSAHRCPGALSGAGKGPWALGQQLLAHQACVVDHDCQLTGNRQRQSVTARLTGSQSSIPPVRRYSCALTADVAGSTRRARDMIHYLTNT